MSSMQQYIKYATIYFSMQRYILNLEDDYATIYFKLWSTMKTWVTKTLSNVICKYLKVCNNVKSMQQYL